MGLVLSIDDDYIYHLADKQCTTIAKQLLKVLYCTVYAGALSLSDSLNKGTWGKSFTSYYMGFGYLSHKRINVQ